MQDGAGDAFAACDLEPEPVRLHVIDKSRVEIAPREVLQPDQLESASGAQWMVVMQAKFPIGLVLDVMLVLVAVEHEVAGEIVVQAGPVGDVLRHEVRPERSSEQGGLQRTRPGRLHAARQVVHLRPVLHVAGGVPNRVRSGQPG